MTARPLARLAGWLRSLPVQLLTARPLTWDEPLGHPDGHHPFDADGVYVCAVCSLLADVLVLYPCEIERGRAAVRARIEWPDPVEVTGRGYVRERPWQR